MTPRFLFLPLLLLASPLVASEDYPKQFEKLLKDKDYKAALALTARWHQAEPKNPQASIEEANVYFSQAYHDAVAIVQKTPTGDDMVLTKQDDPKEQWVMTDGGGYDAKEAQKGIDLLEKTVAQYPYRADIWLGLAYIYNKLGQFPKFLDVADRGMAYTSAHPTGLQGRDGEPVTEAVDKLMIGEFQGYCSELSQSGDAKAAGKVLKIGKLMVKYFPGNSYGYDNIGGAYAAQKKWKEAKVYVQKAADLAPDDSLEWNNLGSICRELGQKDEAIRCFQKVVDMNDNPDLVEQAKDSLAELEK